MHYLYHEPRYHTVLLASSSFFFLFFRLMKGCLDFDSSQDVNYVFQNRVFCEESLTHSFGKRTGGRELLQGCRILFWRPREINLKS